MRPTSRQTSTRRVAEPEWVVGITTVFGADGQLSVVEYLLRGGVGGGVQCGQSGGPGLSTSDSGQHPGSVVVGFDFATTAADVGTR